MEWSLAGWRDSLARRIRVGGRGLVLLLGSSSVAGCAREADPDDPFADYGSAAALDAGMPSASPPGPKSSGEEARDSTASPDAMARADAGSSPDDARLSPAGSKDACADDALAPQDAAESIDGAAFSDDAAAGPDEPAPVDMTLDPPDASLPPIASTATPGDLLITEIMFAPWGPEPQSEWFEIYNTSGDPKLLSGLTIQDGYPRTHAIAADPPVVVPSQAYVVLVRDRAVAVANVVPDAAIVYEYGAGLPPGQGIELENDASGALSLWNGSTLLADVPYGPWGLTSYGQSIELDALEFVGSDDVASWCLAENPWAAGSDDGTPGADNDCP
jgi:hypothetical protein